MTYSLSRQADADIVALYLAGAAAFGVPQAERYQVGLQGCLENLASQPLIGRERTEFRPPVRIHFYQAHVIVYVLDGRDILILRILHGRQDWERLL